MRGFNFLAYVVLSICCWGLFGPVLFGAQSNLGVEVDGVQQLSWAKALLLMSVAYGAVAAAYPGVLLWRQGESGQWTARGVFWSAAGGAIEGLGACAVVLAFYHGGDAISVMPLVFAGAPLIGTVVQMLLRRTWGRASLFFYLGALIVLIGGLGVMLIEPNTGPDAQSAGQRNGTFTGWLATVGFVALAAACWGVYGSLVHAGQQAMHSSKLRPMICSGLAFLLVGFLTALFGLGGDVGSWFHFGGGLLAIVAGALLVLAGMGIVQAFDAGGQPSLVMPLVFGAAPVVNTICSSFAVGQWGNVSTWYWISLALLISGAVVVLRFTPTNEPSPDETPATDSPSSATAKRAETGVGEEAGGSEPKDSPEPKDGDA